MSEITSGTEIESPSQEISWSGYVGLGICAVYHLVILGSALYLAWILDWTGQIESKELALRFILFGIFGGTFYCLRALYRHGCLYMDWSNRWVVWHLLRPFTAGISGLAAFILVQGGLVLLDASNQGGENQALWGHYFVAFIAGLNVDQFQRWLERLAESTLGIKPSNQGR